jgi:uncharacterized protein (TIGR00255 family)
MTGYGRAQKTCLQADITVEIRAVNHRYLDCSVKVPRLFAYLEEAVKALVQKSVSRGKTDVSVTLELASAENVRVCLNRPLAEGYLFAMRAMAAEYGLRDDVPVMALARMPDVFTIRQEEPDAGALTREVCAVAGEALAQFAAMRGREGAHLAEDIRASLDAMDSLIARLEARSPQTVEEYRARLDARMREVLDGVGVDETRILAEAALYADRIAIGEETVRLRSHGAQIRALLKSGGAVGRKLDFLVQECNREANTIGSKGHDTEIAMMVVDLKAEIEKIREQAQNIE